MRRAQFHVHPGGQGRGRNGARLPHQRFQNTLLRCHTHFQKMKEDPNLGAGPLSFWEVVMATKKYILQALRSAELIITEKGKKATETLSEANREVKIGGCHALLQSVMTGA